MNRLWLLAKSNITKNKSVSVTLAVMFVISAMLFNAGLLLTVNYGSFFGRLKDELNAADAYLMIPDALYTDEVIGYIDANGHIKAAQSETALILGAEILSQGKEQSFSILFYNMDRKREMSKWKYVGPRLPESGLKPGEMPVFVPDIFKAVSGYELGDKMTLKYTDEETREEKSIIFTVMGYTEDVFFSSTDTGLLGFYLPEETYNLVAGILSHPNHLEHIVFTKLDEVASAAKVESGIRELLELNSASLISGDASEMLLTIDIELVELSRCMMASMVAMMMVVFALIIVTVCLLVVRFRIVNSIEDDMMKIGSLKSVGYTNRQIIMSVLLQFLLVSGIGSILGIALSYPVLPAVSLIFEQQSGLKWEQGFDAAVSGSALIILLLIVTLVSIAAARKVGRLSPVNALRGESSARGYKRNTVPIETAKWRLPVVLAIKSVLQNMKLNITIAIIVAAVTFAGSYGVIMYYNTSVDTKAFAEVPGMEITNAIAVLNPEKDHAEAIGIIKKMDRVRKVLYHDEVKIKIDGTDVSCYVMEDYGEKETRLIYDGRYPETENEISVAGILSGRIGIKTGDTVSVRVGEQEETFKVVGLYNGSSMGGMNVCMLAADYKGMNPDFRPQNLYIYLDEGSDTSAFIGAIEERLDKELLLGTSNFDKLLAEGMAAYQNIVAVMGLAMLVITLLVVTLVLYFVIGSSIIRRKRELGIQKAIGFTTFQLMTQLAMGFIAPVFLGSVLGSLLGAFCTNPMMSVLMKGVGVMKANFIVNPLWVFIFGAGTVVFSYLLSLLITWRIRKISAYALVTE